MVTLALLVIGFGAWEVVLRRAGYPPEVSPAVWSIARARAGMGVPVIVGSSRIQAALDLDVWVRERGEPRPAQLAMAGGPALPMLEDLAGDEGVTGLVIADALPFHTFDTSGQSGPSVRIRAAEYSRFVRSPAARLETRLRAGFSGAMVWRNPAAGPASVWASLRAGDGLPDAPHSALRRDRYRPIDFVSSLGDRQWTPEEGFMAADGLGLARRLGRPATPDEVAGIVTRLDAAASRIRERGGEVVFITMPACGPRRAVEEARYPEAEFWDRLVAGTSARTINAAEDVRLNDFPCYDGSHLDRRDAAVFTRNLLDVLFRTGG